MTRFAAAIISGGNATRMGFDKQLISIDGLVLRDYQISMLKLLFSEIIVVTNRPELYDHGVKCVKDILPFRCPLTGIHSALSNTSCDAVFVIACDMPILDMNFIKEMIDAFLKNNPRKTEDILIEINNLAGDLPNQIKFTGNDVCVPKTETDVCFLKTETDVCVPEYEGYLEPLHAIYSTRCIVSIEDYLNLGKCKISNYFENINLVRFPASNPDLFINLNEPSDLKKLEIKNGIIVLKGKDKRVFSKAD